MNEDTLNDLKQFITATVSQQTSQIVDELTEKIDGVELRVIKKIDDLSESVAEALDNSNEETAKRLDDHDSRLSKLETKIA